MPLTDTASELTENSFKTIALLWHDEQKRKVWKSPKSAADALQKLKKYIFPTLGPRPIKEISLQDLELLIMSIESKRNRIANRTLGFCKGVYEYAIKIGKAKENIAAKIIGKLPQGKKETDYLHDHYKSTEVVTIAEITMIFRTKDNTSFSQKDKILKKIQENPGKYPIYDLLQRAIDHKALKTEGVDKENRDLVVTKVELAKWAKRNEIKITKCLEPLIPSVFEKIKDCYKKLSDLFSRLNLRQKIRNNLDLIHLALKIIK